jgi:hypothetical protein
MTELRRQDAKLSCREGADTLLPPLARGRLLISPFALITWRGEQCQATYIN